MEDFIMLLFKFVIMGVVINVAVEYTKAVIKSFHDIDKFALVIACAYSMITVVAFNKGMMTTLEVPIEASLQPMFHYVDLFLTGVVMTGGAKAVRTVAQGVAEYRIKKQDVK